MKAAESLVLGALVLSPIVCFAGGMLRHYKCESSACGFQGDFNLTPRTVAGYCHTCTNFVYVRWSRGEKASESIGTVWNPATGEFADLYACPACKKPFLSITDLGPCASGTNTSNKIDCPRCKRHSLVVGDLLIYD